MKLRLIARDSLGFLLISRTQFIKNLIESDLTFFVRKKFSTDWKECPPETENEEMCFHGNGFMYRGCMSSVSVIGSEDIDCIPWAKLGMSSN